MNKNNIMVIALLFSTMFLMAQSKIVTGTVVSELGEPLPGASIVIKGVGEELVGSTTDFDGLFSIEVKDNNAVLIVSFMGYTEQEISVFNKNEITIRLLPNVDSLDEVVVTALGIKREKKALGYSVQVVGGDDLAGSSRLSPIEGLSGKISGLNISSSSSGPGGSTKVLIRGVNSLTGSNTPLFVVDGVPLDNSGGVTGGAFGGFDYGNAANNINTDDIETIAVLKGGAASALYGSRGQNGVIMITTKKGSKKDGLGISISSGFEISNPLIKPDFQNEYAQGSNGKYDHLSYRSWGAKMVGQEETNFLNESQILKSNAEQHPYDTYFNAGSTFNNTLTINKRGDISGTYFSASRSYNKGILPNSEYVKNSFTVRFDTELSSYLKLDAKVNYIDQEAENRPNLAGSPDNPIYLMTGMPRSVSLNQLENYQTVDGYPVLWTSTYNKNNDDTISWMNNPPSFASSPLLQNPYWITDLNTNNDNRNRIIGFSELTLNLKELLNLGFSLEVKGKAGIDYYSENRKRITADKTYFKADGKATLSQVKQEVKEENFDLLISMAHNWGSFNAHASFGGNLMHRAYRGLNTSSQSGLINDVGPYVIQNFLNPITGEGMSDVEIQSLYSLFSFDYNSEIYMDVTFRKDWTSVLSPENWSYLYPSVSFSWIMNKTLELPEWVSFLKLRGSYAGVGNGGNYASYRYSQFGTNPNQFHGLPYGIIPSKRPELNLKSEYTESIEAGINALMFGRRLEIDLSYYESGTRDQIFNAPLAPSSGYNSGVINAGFINNSGIEMSINGEVLRTEDLSVNLGLNASRSWSNVENLNDEVDILTLGGAGGVSIAAKPGEPVGIIMGSAFERDDQGRLVIDEENLPKIKTTEDGAIDYEQIIGNAYPEWLLGVNGSVKYKNFFLNFQIDSKLGHDLFSMTNQRGAQYGTLAFTTEGRDEWENAKKIAELTGTEPNDGYMVSGVKNGEAGSFPTDPQKYWDRASRVGEAFIYDASYVRLRQIGLSYSFDKNKLANTPFRSVVFSVMANNLLYLYKEIENVSPESTFGTGNAVGYEMFSFPEVKTFSLNIKANF